MPRSFGLPQLAMQPFGASQPQKPLGLGQDPMEPLSPEMFFPFDEQEAALRQQMAMAQALRGKPVPRHTTGIGGLFGALGAGVDAFNGGLQEGQAQSAMDLLVKKRGAAEAQKFGLTQALAAQKAAREEKLAREKLEADKAKMKQHGDIEAAKIAAYGRKHKGNGANNEKLRELPASLLTELAGYDTAIQGVEGLLKDFHAKGESGAVAKAGARLTDFFGLGGTDAAQYEAGAAPVRQSVGTILEKGKLQAADEGKYKNMMPKPGDSPEVAAQKVAKLKEALMREKAGKIAALKAGGYQVPGDEAAAQQTPEAVPGADKHAQALEWAKANPNDPRAAKILALQGGK